MQRESEIERGGHKLSQSTCRHSRSVCETERKGRICSYVDFRGEWSSKKCNWHGNKLEKKRDTFGSFFFFFFG